MATKRTASSATSARAATANKPSRRVRMSKAEREAEQKRLARNEAARARYAARQVAERKAEREHQKKLAERREKYRLAREAAAKAAAKAAKAAKAAAKAAKAKAAAKAAKAPAKPAKAPKAPKVVQTPAKAPKAVQAPAKAPQAPAKPAKPATLAHAPKKGVTKPTAKPATRKPPKPKKGVAKPTAKKAKPVDVSELVTPFDQWHVRLMELREKYKKRIKDKFTIKGKDRPIKYRHVFEEQHANGKYSYHVVVEMRVPVMDSTVPAIMSQLRREISKLYAHAAIKGKSSAFASLRLTEFTTAIVGSPDPNDFRSDEEGESVFMQTWQGTTAQASETSLVFALQNLLAEVSDESMRGATFLEYAVIRVYDEG